MLNKREKKAVKIVVNELENIYKYHNKNLTKKQYYTIEDCSEVLLLLLNRGVKNGHEKNNK